MHCYSQPHGKDTRLQFVVVSKGRQSLICASDSERLGLVARECGVRKVCTVKENWVLTSAEIKKEYPDIFKGLGCLEGTCKIHLRQNYLPLCVSGEESPAVSDRGAGQSRNTNGLGAATGDSGEAQR